LKMCQRSNEAISISFDNRDQFLFEKAV